MKPVYFMLVALALAGCAMPENQPLTPRQQSYFDAINGVPNAYGDDLPLHDRAAIRANNPRGH